jgi:hypothetical protein
MSTAPLDPVSTDTTYEYNVFPNLEGYGGSLPDSNAYDGGGETVIGISTTDGNFTAVPSSGTVTIDGSEISLQVDANGDDEANLLYSTDQTAAAINANEAQSPTPLSDTFYYEVEGTGGNVTVDELTWTYGDVDINAPASLSFGATVADQTGTAVELNGGGDTSNDFTVNKMDAVPAATNLEVGITAYDFTGGDYSGTFAVNTGGGATVDESAAGYLLISGTETQIDAALATLTYTGQNTGEFTIGLSTVDNNPATGYSSQGSTGEYATIDVSTGPVTTAPPVNISNTYDYNVSPGLVGFGSSLPATNSDDGGGETVIGISTTDGNFTAVPSSGTVTIDGTYVSLQVDASGDDSVNLLYSSDQTAAAINTNETTSATPLSDTFFYEVEDTSNNVTVDEVTWTYGDVDVDAPASLSYGATITDSAPGTAVALNGGGDTSNDITVNKLDAVPASTDLEVGISAFDFTDQDQSGTFTVDTSGGATVDESSSGLIVLSGTETQINAALGTLTYTGQDPGQFTIGVYTVDNDAATGYSYQSGTGDYVTVDVNCFRAGTRILTERGEVAVEHLVAGDAVVIAREGSQATRPVTWTGHRKIDLRRHPNAKANWPVRVLRGAFADDLPSHDLWLSPGHSVYAEGKLVQIENLINGKTILQVPCDEVDYWHVELDSHDILYANGLACESYLETGNRAAFLGGASVLELHPDFEPKHWSETCVPLVFEGKEIELTKAALLARAEKLGYAVTSDNDLHVLADGRRIEPTALAPNKVAFLLPPCCADIRLNSRTFTPAHTRAASRDTRLLGLCIGRLQLDGNDVALDDDSIVPADGWNFVERDGDRPCRRWTTGSAKLPPATRLVVIELGGRGYYWAQADESRANEAQTGAMRLSAWRG